MDLGYKSLIADVDCYAEARLSLRVKIRGVFLIKFQCETNFYLLVLIFFVLMWIQDGFENDLSINLNVQRPLGGSP